MTIFDLFHALGVIVLGATGWFVLEFFGRPIREFFSLRREIRHLMLLHWDDPSAEDLNFYDEDGDPRVSPDEWDEPRAAFSEVAARLGSFDQGEPFASWIVNKMGFDLLKATRQLREIGSLFGMRGEKREAKFMKIDSALRFRVKQHEHSFYSPHGHAR